MSCMLWAASEGMAGGELALLYVVVPMAWGRSRLLSLPLSTSPAFLLPAKIFHAAPWLHHLFNRTVAAHQDAAILHRQGAALAAADFPGWRRGFFSAHGDKCRHHRVAQVAGRLGERGLGAQRGPGAARHARGDARPGQHF